MSYSYDSENIFAKILRGDIPNATVLETDYTLAFKDITPKAPDHVLVIPKGAYVNYDDFCQNASDPEILDFMRACGQICKDLGVEDKGFRAITNAGEHGCQEVPHFHMHILAGKVMGPLLAE
ncbi:HIT domain-containing protein [Thioclava sp. GXIMD2076]|uniref:HIT domain-containing protein n=1 Tax=Thioclava kandeliae TaxID=3070818 RepID=A0ABV1SE78_9RHOB